jgi:ABC-type transport system substrate-binding protein
MASTRWLAAGALLVVVLIVVASGPPAASQTPARPAEGKAGGILKVMQTVWPASPCFGNLVYFDPFKKLESPDTIVGELAERWAWQDGGRTLVFSLRRDVRWHDGQPFTSKDAKYTFDKA